MNSLIHANLPLHSLGWRRSLRYFGLFLCLLTPLFTQAHPSWGIVAAPNGDIYFVDVLHHDGTLWKLSPEGELTVVMRRFHAHDLQIDTKGNLWLAANIWRQGEIEGDGLNMLVKIDPLGNKDTLILTYDQDFLLGSIFAVDQQERVYFTHDKQIYRRTIQGKPELLLHHRFERINSLEIDAKGNLYITDKRHKGGSVYRWNDQEGLTEFATELLEQNPKQPTFPEKRFHLFYAFDQGPENCFYISDNSSRKIQRLGPNGERQDYYQSEWPWHPLGICFSGGNAYIMEGGFDHKNIGPRILRIDASGRYEVLVEMR